MRFDQNRSWATALALVLLFAGTTTAVIASGEEDAELHVKRVHKIVVNCDEGSAEDCEQAIHIEALGDDSHVMRVGDHEMVWVESGEHGSHYTFGFDAAGNGGYLGIQLTDLTSELRAHFGVAGDEGVMVAKVIDDSAAFRAGLAAGDIITRVDGESVDSSRTLTHAIRAREEGEIVDLEIWRDGSPETVSATLDENQQTAHLRRHVTIDCDDDEADCGAYFMGSGSHGMAVDCPDGEECDVRVNCDDGECNCTLNGEAIDCQEIHRQHGHDD